MWSTIDLASSGLALMLRNQDQPSSSGSESQTAWSFPPPSQRSSLSAAADSAPSAFLSFFHTFHKYHPFLHRCPTLFRSSSPSIEAFTCLVSQRLLSTYLTFNHEILRSTLFILFTCSCLAASPPTTAFLQYGLEPPTIHLTLHQRRPSITFNIFLVESHTRKRNSYLSRRPKTFTRRGRIESRRRLLPCPTSSHSARARE